MMPTNITLTTAARRAFCALALLAIIAGPATAAPTVATAPIKIEVRVDRATAQVAQPFTLTVTVTAPENVAVQFPVSGEQLGTLDVVATSETLDIPRGQQRVSTRRYTLESLRSGEQRIPAIAVSYVDRRQADPVSDIVESTPIPIAITSVLEGQADPLKYRDIKDVVDLPAPPPGTPAWVAWSLGAAGALAVASLMLLVIPARRRRLSPRDWAIEQLASLGAKDLRDVEPATFFADLTDIVRQYAQRQFHIAAPQLTTAEFVTQLQQHPQLNDSSREYLHELLAQADLVKFARFDPGEDAQAALEAARRFILDAAASVAASNSTTTKPSREAA